MALYTHSGQQCGFSPVCVRMWRVRAPDVVARELHSVQAYARTFLCLASQWARRAKEEAARYVQSEQLYGFSPVWTRLCTVKAEAVAAR